MKIPDIVFDHYNEAVKLPYPPELQLTDIWKEVRNVIRSVIKARPSVEQVIQISQGVKFNHRTPASPIIFMLKELFEKKYPGISLGPGDSLYSRNETLLPYNGITLSNIYFWHLSHYYACATRLPYAPINIAEIGSGIGELARLWRLMGRNVFYTLIDFPEALFMAEVYLRANFPNDMHGFKFVPIQKAHKIKNHFDLVINIGSLQEQRTASVKYWMGWIQSRADYFYSFNSFMNHKNEKLTSPQDHTAAEVVPIIDDKWNIVSFELNDELFRINTTSNWLAVILKREKALPEDVAKKYVESLSQVIILMRFGSKTATRLIWELFWKDPTHAAAKRWVEYLERLEIRDAVGFRRIMKEHESTT